MASIGDSITAGTFANTSLKDFSVPPEKPWRDVSVFKWIATNVWLQNKTVSWASGAFIKSHFGLLRDYLEEIEPDSTLEMINAAVPGNRSVDLLPQAEKVLELMQSKKFTRLKYVTLMVGANDLCWGNTGDIKMGNYLMSIFEILSKIEQDKIPILVSAIPRIADLGLDDVRNSFTVGGALCARVLKRIFPACPSMTNWSTPFEYHQRLQLLENKNHLIEFIVTEAQSRFKNLDIFYTDAVSRVEVSSKYLAADCFHPNSKAQAEISRALWQAQPWFK